MALHLTFCIRAEVNPTETLDLARRIERGDVVLAEEGEMDGDFGPEWGLSEVGTPRERETVIAALRAFA